MKRYDIPLNLLLIAVAVYFCVAGFYQVSLSYLGPVYPSRINTQTVTTPELVAHRPLSYYNVIIERNLFNTKTGEDQAPEKLDLEALKPTALKLKLLGTVSGNNKDTYAVIEEAGNKRQQLYRIGDTIQDAVVKSILREKVVLHVNGEDEILAIEKKTDKASAETYPSRTYAASTLNRTSDTVEKISLQRTQIDAAVQDINSLMKEVRIRPHFTNGEPDGLRLTGIRPNSIFYRMGLKSGDVITGVDGKNIVSVDDALQLYQSLQSSSDVKVDIKRMGRAKILEYHIE